MKIKTCDLVGVQLDWAVAVCEGEIYSAVPTYNGIGMEFPATLYSTDWALGGPIIERERIHVCPITYNDLLAACECWLDGRQPKASFYGPTILIAAMRCYVASKLGDEVDIPDVLTKEAS